MSDYRRNRVPGGTYFFTVNLQNRRSNLLVQHIDASEDDADYSKRWRAIKTAFSKALPGDQNRADDVWQNRFWEHTIRDERDYAAHMDYTHFNPVKHGLAGAVADWPFSSFRRCVEKGIYPRDWVKSPVELAEAGERTI